MRANIKDVAAGGLFIAIGGYFAIDSMIHLRMGTAISMGPGFFPRILGLALICLGVAIVAVAIGKENEEMEAVPWRGVILIMVSIIFFGFTIRGLGMLTSLGLSTFLASIASGKLSVLASVITSVIIAIVSVLIFIVLIKLPYPIIGPWIGG